MADMGLIGGLAEGLRSGIESYRTERSYRDQKEKEAQELAIKKMLANSQLLQHDQQADTGGNVSWTDSGLLSKNLKDTQSKHSIAEYDPNSKESKNATSLTSGILGAADPKLEGLLPQGMSAADIKEANKEGLTGKTVGGIYGMQGRQITAARIGEGNQIKRESLDLRKDSQASHAVDTVHKDPRVLQLTKQMEQLERGRGILDQPTITNQEFNDYQQEIQAAISGAGGGALGKLERTEYVSMQQSLAALKQKITGSPQDAVPKEIVERLKALADHTRDVMDKHRSDRASSLNRNFRSNDAANEEMGKAISAYKPGDKNGLMNAPKPEPTGLVQQGMSQADKDAITWAISNKEDPRAVQILNMHGLK